MGKEWLCYQCFHRFKPREVWFRRQNPAPEDNQTEVYKIEMDSKLKEINPPLSDRNVEFYRGGQP
jgi:hypothetical protein